MINQNCSLLNVNMKWHKMTKLYSRAFFSVWLTIWTELLSSLPRLSDKIRSKNLRCRSMHDSRESATIASRFVIVCVFQCDFSCAATKPSSVIYVQLLLLRWTNTIAAANSKTQRQINRFLLHFIRLLLLLFVCIHFELALSFIFSLFCSAPSSSSSSVSSHCIFVLCRLGLAETSVRLSVSRRTTGKILIKIYRWQCCRRRRGRSRRRRCNIIIIWMNMTNIDVGYHIQQQ